MSDIPRVSNSSKNVPMKMQDIFGISEDKNKNEIKEENDNKNTDNALFDPKSSLYLSIYESTSLFQDKIQKEEIHKANLQRKNNLLNYKKDNKNDDLSYIEQIKIFIDDTNYRLSEIIIQNFECKFVFDENVEFEFINLVHFSPKYFEFPIFYASQGYYDETTHITTITLKDYRSFKLASSNNKIFKKLLEPPNNRTDFYKYAIFYKNQQDKNNIKYKINGWEIYQPDCEYLRQGVDFSNTKFCFSGLNNNYQLCETYPKELVIPKQFDNNKLIEIAQSRKKNRFPILSYYYSLLNNKESSYLYRSAQINSKSKSIEVEYMNYICNLDNNGKGFIIFDCRPGLNAKVNALKGGGVEDISLYKNCKGLFFGCIENIHCVRDSLEGALEKAYYGKENIEKGKICFNIKNSNMTNFLSKFEKTKWNTYLSDLLLGSILVAKNLSQNINVLVHCSDGWDRTSQVCSLVQIILDPYFRTLEGFAVLVEKDWVSFGHQFAIRNGCELKPSKERSPIFIQFLHAVYQMIVQYPTAFEFNSYFLLFLSEQIYSNKYGTFLFNCEKEKINNKAETSMVSIWSDIFYEKNKYINDLFKPYNGMLSIKGEVQYLSIWNEFFFKYDKVGIAWDDQIILDRERYVSTVVEEKNKSIIELLKIIKSVGKEDLMKNNKIYKLYKNELEKDN